MKLLRLSATILLSTPLLLSTSVQADEAKHLYDAAQENPALQKSFAEIVSPVIKDAPWLKDYGTTAPPTKATIDDKEYELYWGCKPHDCTSESYTVAYDVAAKKFVAGAFVVNELQGPNVASSKINWLGETDWDLAKLIGNALY